MPQLDLRFLGLPGITLDGKPVHLARRHSLAVLAYLALTGRAYTRDELATLLASESADVAARKLLRNVLSDLAANGLGDYLLTNRQSVAFNASQPHTLDVARLDALLDPTGADGVEELTWVSEYCDQELLAGLALRDAPLFELWLVSEREHRRQQLTLLCLRLLEQQYWSGQLEAGIALARRLLTVDPWQEEAHRLLMRLLARDGQLPAALTQYERCRRMLADELGAEPQPATVALAERLRAGPVSPRHNLPTFTASDDLFGRDGELDSVCRSLVDASCRLLTIAGIGGIGKTSLALAAGMRLAAPGPLTDDHPFADGIFHVSQTRIAGSGEPGADGEHALVTAIGVAIGVAFYGRIDRREQLIAFLQAKRVLLILDGMEQLVDGSPALRDMLQRAPGVTLLATSRTPLGVAEEWVQQLGMLDQPESAAEVDECPASQLFLREARRLSVPLVSDNSVAIVEICRHTGGLPLAIKLAAGWLGVLTCTEIASELRHGSGLVSEPPSHTDESRPPSVRAIMESAVASLTEREQQSLERLAVFSGTFTQPAAEAVGVPFASLLALCRRAIAERHGDERYALHPLIRQLASELLASQPDEEAAARDAHADWYAAFVTRHAPTLFQRAEAHLAIANEHANLRAAWDWAVTQEDFELFRRIWGGMAIWHRMAGLHREWSESVSRAIGWLSDDCTTPERCSVVVRLLVATADSLLWQGAVEQALPLIHQARRTASAVNALELEAIVSLCEGRILFFRGEGDSAIEALRRAQVLAQATRQPSVEAESLLALSMLSSDLGQVSEAESQLRRASELFESLGDRLVQGRLLMHRGRLGLITGDFTRATLDFEQCLQHSRAFGDRPTEGWASASLGAIADSGYGRHADADALLAQGVEIARQTGDRYAEAYALTQTARNALHAGDLMRAEEYFERVVERGREIGNQVAVSFGLLGLGQLALARENAPIAEERAQQALRVLSDINRLHLRPPVLVLLGRARQQLGLPAEAADAFAQASVIAEAQSLLPLRWDAMTGLASCALAAGNLGLALHHVEPLARALHEHALAGCEDPGWTIWTCYRVLRSAGDSRAEEVLHHGAVLLERRVNALPEQQRQGYLAASGDRRSVLHQWLSELAPLDAPARALLALNAR